MPWNVNDSVSNVPPEGTYKMRINEIVADVSKDGNPVLRFKCEIVQPETDKPKQTYTRSLLPQALGILGRDLANSNVYTVEELNGDNDLDISNPHSIVAALTDRMGNRTFMYDVKHREYQGRKTGDFTLVGPGSSI